MQRALIIHRIIAPYRVPFYEQLREVLRLKGIELQLIYGEPAENESDPYIDVEWGKKLRTRYMHIGKKFVAWMPALRHVRRGDLVIVHQANNYFINHVLIALRQVLGFRMAFWGHGRNFQGESEYSVGEYFKRMYSASVDHWFAYTDLSKTVVKKLGFPEEKITSVNNAIDTNDIVRLTSAISDFEIRGVRDRYGLKDNSAVGVFCSRLYSLKRLGFLMRSAASVKRLIKEFQLIVIGDGPGAPMMAEFSRKNRDWVHYVGAQFGRQKAVLFSVAQFQLMPGAVGLNIVDSFAHLTPIITTDIGTHGPEISYLENGTNGVMTDNRVEAYVSEIVRLIQDHNYQEKLREGCRRARAIYTIENMVERFAEGVYTALQGDRN